MSRKVVSLMLIIVLALSLTSCSGRKKGEKGEDVTSSVRQLCSPKEGDTIVTIVTGKGTIKAVIYDDLVPKTAQNFMDLADTGYYDGMIVHKTIKNFVMQFGDKTLKGDGGESFSGQGVSPEYRDDLHSYTGALGMVVYGDGLQYSQFFIIAGDTVSDAYIEAMQKAGYSPEVIDAFKELGGQPQLDYVYTIFGQVYEGLDIVKDIASQDTDKYNRPKKDITIKTVSISSYTSEE